jgi:type III pantothenate kinase
MQLAIDIGNTDLKFALFETVNKQFFGKGLEELKKSIVANNVSSAIISDVTQSSQVIELLKNQNIPVQTLSSATPLPIKNAYQSPETLGTDRIAVAVAAAQHFPHQDVLIICAGSCITYNFVSKESEYLGGGISPGISMRFKALKAFTAKLPLIEHEDELSKIKVCELVGNNTASSILSGVLNGVLHEVQGTIEQYNSRYGNLPVLITGGNADFFVSKLKNEIFAHPDLVLEGLNSILLYHA